VIDLTTYGRAVNVTRPIVGRVTLDEQPSDRRSEFVLTSDVANRLREGYRAVLTTAKVEPAEVPSDVFCLHSAKQISHLKTGDIVVLHQNGHVRTLFRPDSDHNALLVTERCNSFCLMCSQPPIDRDDTELVNINLEAIRLIQPSPASLGITGGEPTLLGEGLFRILTELRDRLPETAIHMLTNGRRFAWPEFTELFIEARHPKLMVGIPVYADNAFDHDYIVQASGAFDQTIKGLHQLALYDQPIEIRVVLHALTIPRLKQLAEFIYRNIPFAAHVALMGLEITGFTRPNIDKLWIDPFDYQTELSNAVEFLSIRGMNVSIYNHQLCLLPHSLWGFARRSISDWKNLYLDECSRCSVRFRCGGLFKSGLIRHSSRIGAIPPKEDGGSAYSKPPTS